MKKHPADEIVFRIDAFNPNTLPMEKLAEYLKELTVLYGSKEHVHFIRVGPGSANLIKKSDPHATPDIKHRLRLVSAKNGPEEALQAYGRINRLLIRDNAIGDIRIGGGKIISFPGRKTPALEIIGPIKQHDFLDGELIRIGGKDESIPVHIREEETVRICTTNVDIARRLGPYLYGDPIRVFGTATWTRQPETGWELEKFIIEGFEPLIEKTLGEALTELQKSPIKWPENVLEEIGALRKTHEKNGRH